MVRKRDRKLESFVEDATVNYAREKYQALVVKLNLRGFSHLPDRLFIGRWRTIFFIEFKREGGELRPGQEVIIRKLREWGFNCHVISDTRTGQEVVKEEFKAGKERSSQVVAAALSD